MHLFSGYIDCVSRSHEMSTIYRSLRLTSTIASGFRSLFFILASNADACASYIRTIRTYVDVDKWLARHARSATKKLYVRPIRNYKSQRWWPSSYRLVEFLREGSVNWKCRSWMRSSKHPRLFRSLVSESGSQLCHFLSTQVRIFVSLEIQSQLTSSSTQKNLETLLFQAERISWTVI